MTERVGSLTPNFTATSPWVPKGATDWEAQEIKRHWRLALSALDDVQRAVDGHGDRLLNRGRHRTPPDAMHFDHRFSGGGLAGRALEAEGAMIAMARVIDGCLHRLAEKEGS